MSVSLDTTLTSSTATGLSWPQISKEEILEKISLLSFKIGSYLTDPVCKSHEYYRSIYIVDALNPHALKISNLFRKAMLAVGVVLWGALALWTTLPGIGIKSFASAIQKHPYLSLKQDIPGKILPKDSTFSLLSWNICGVTAGYSISDGGVLPWSYRLERIVQSIVDANADVNCLYEVFDIQTAVVIADKLKEKGYKHCYYNIGPKAVGVSSGMLIASKYETAQPEFTQFPEETLVGRTKYAAKGVFAFDLQSQGKSFARVHATHLQQSEEPAFPTQEEIEGRKKQMEIIVDKIQKIKDKCIIVTGDLNLDDQEYQQSFWQKSFQIDQSFKDNKKTWGGDGFCAQMVGKKISGPLNLDHTITLNGTAYAIKTTLLPTGFEGTSFKEEALSDHEGIFSQITLK
jgi:endonuclease/exonuclease/phosphatase family metal-dependent hydrolase